MTIAYTRRCAAEFLRAAQRSTSTAYCHSTYEYPEAYAHSIDWHKKNARGMIEQMRLLRDLMEPLP